MEHKRGVCGRGTDRGGFGEVEVSEHSLDGELGDLGPVHGVEEHGD
jgi:hypothetical protein